MRTQSNTNVFALIKTVNESRGNSKGIYKADPGTVAALGKGVLGRKRKSK